MFKNVFPHLFLHLTVALLCMGPAKTFAAAKTQKELEAEVLSGSKTDEASEAPVDTPSVKNIPAPKSNRKAEKAEDTAADDNADNEPKVSESKMRRVEEAIVGPKRVPHDQILVVQRKYIEKEGRHEIMPLMVGVQLADSFRRQIQWGFGYAYHFSEMFGVEVIHANFITNYNTGLSQQIAKELTLGTDRVEPVFSLGSSLQFTPLRSKAGAWSSTVYFEGFFLAGGGMTRYETGTAGMAMAGVGFRIYLSPYAILKTEFRNYTDFVKKSSLLAAHRNNRFNILTGMSVLFGGTK